MSLFSYIYIQSGKTENYSSSGLKMYDTSLNPNEHIPRGTKFLPEFIFADSLFSVFCGN